MHRFPGSMAERIQTVARIVVEEYDGQAERIWTEATDANDLLRRMTALPGFGKQKSQIFVALLAKQLGVRPEGWEAVVGDYSQEGYRSVADVVDVDVAGEGARVQEGEEGGRARLTTSLVHEAGQRRSMRLAVRADPWSP